jgi:hypothetical protein
MVQIRISGEGLYCKRPIKCLASFKILTPHLLTARRVCHPLPLVRGGGHIGWVERGWGVNINILEDARHCSKLYICKYFVRISISNGSGVAIFVTFKMATKNYFFYQVFFVYFFLKLHLHHLLKIKSQKEITKQEE